MFRFTSRISCFLTVTLLFILFFNAKFQYLKVFAIIFLQWLHIFPFCDEYFVLPINVEFYLRQITISASAFSIFPNVCGLFPIEKYIFSNAVFPVILTKLTIRVCVFLFYACISHSDDMNVLFSAGVSRFSGGCIYHVPLYRSDKPLQVTTLERMFQRYLTRKIGFESVMRLRCTR